MIWNDRGLYISPIKYALCISEKKFKKELKRLKINEAIPFIFNGAKSTVHYFKRTSNNDECCIVCVEMNLKIDLLQYHGLLVHEAVHSGKPSLILLVRRMTMSLKHIVFKDYLKTFFIRMKN